MSNVEVFEPELPLWRQSATQLLHAALMLRHDVEQRLHDERGLLLADNEALLRLAHTDTPMRMSEIAECLVLSRGGTTKLVDRLEAMALARRHPDPQDRRATLVEITEAGRAALAEARLVIDAALEELWAAHISDEEARTILRIVDRAREANPSW